MLASRVWALQTWNHQGLIDVKLKATVPVRRTRKDNRTRGRTIESCPAIQKQKLLAGMHVVSGKAVNTSSCGCISGSSNGTKHGTRGLHSVSCFSHHHPHQQKPFGGDLPEEGQRLKEGISKRGRKWPFNTTATCLGHTGLLVPQ